jgi:tetratricopeptide (TPR) repeat protein
MAGGSASTSRILYESFVLFCGDDERVSVTDEKIAELLERTAATTIPEAERLRRLGVYLENRTLDGDWLGLRKVYEVALELDPDNPEIRRSWGLSAIEWYYASREPGFQGEIELHIDGEEQLGRDFREEEEGPLSITDAGLEAFLRRTGTSFLSPAERLRILAIFLEEADFQDGWEGMRRIYRRAAREDPEDSRVFDSWGTSASGWCDGRPELSDGERGKIASDAESAYRRALELEPTCGDPEYGTGLLYYKNHLVDVREAELHGRALGLFSRALERDPDNVMAQLYIGHCFHDREEWEQAIQAYLAVDQEKLASEWPAWRAVKLRQQIAGCYAGAGEHAEAVRRFREFLGEIEAFDDEAFEDRVVDLSDLAESAREIPFDEELLRRTEAAEARLKACWDRFDKEFGVSDGSG